MSKKKHEKDRMSLSYYYPSFSCFLCTFLFFLFSLRLCASAVNPPFPNTTQRIDNRRGAQTQREEKDSLTSHFSLVAARLRYTTIRRFLVFCARFSCSHFHKVLFRYRYRDSLSLSILSGFSDSE